MRDDAVILLYIPVFSLIFAVVYLKKMHISAHLDLFSTKPFLYAKHNVHQQSCLWLVSYRVSFLSSRWWWRW